MPSLSNLPGLNVLIFALKSLAALATIWIAQLLYQGFLMRVMFRSMAARGMPVPQPHSLLLGHLPLMKKLRDNLPKDAHDTYSQRRLITHWEEYFPNQTKCPPIIYLDLWPFLSYPLIYATSPETCYQITQENPQPRHSMLAWSILPVTGGKDLISMDMSDHRVWRARLNPGFSTRNLTSQIPLMIEEVNTFVQQLRSKAGQDHEYGEIFPLYDRTVNLTFDIIMRAAVDLKVNEQLDGPGPILQAMRQLIRHVKGENIMSRLERMMPAYKQDVSRNEATIRNILLPHLKARFGKNTHPNSPKTVIDLALKESKSESRDASAPQDENLLDVVLSHLKLFILAGHDTTAQALCWVFYELYSKPDVLKSLRAEHDQILGPNPKLTLSEQPHKLGSLQYTTAVIKETLRHHPLGSAHRSGSPEFNIVYEGMTYPTMNALINTSPAAIHLRSDLWPQADEFVPERYMVPEGDPLHPIKNAWRVFELGNTRCIGEELAMMEMKLVLALTVREMDMEFDWVGWNKLQKRTAPPDQLNGQYMYRVGHGIGTVKDNLPTRIRLR
ncbi:cytochrome P450 [Xylaria sp. CBS 124048]|nr:cytochrome P450 [Xylaria sp. CBS 124048]